MKPNQCPSTTTDRATDEETRCILPEGHDGRHDDGCLTWDDAVTPTRAAIHIEPTPHRWVCYVDGRPENWYGETPELALQAMQNDTPKLRPLDGIEELHALIGAATTPEPPPTPGTGDVWQSVIDRLPPGRLRDACVERRAFGLKKYGTVLQANNGRDWRKDALQEALDLIAYSAQGGMEDDPEATAILIRAAELAEMLLGGGQ